MTLPDFIIIGAMKAGTTTLFRDLRTHPEIFLPSDKELHCLVDEDVLGDAGRAVYARYFESAAPGQVCGEASTAYTKLPDVTGVPDRAREVLGPALKLIYVVRHPVTRTVSHYFHDASEGKITVDIDEAVRTYPPLLNYSRYAMQLAPWIDRFGSDAIRVIRFEDYVADRRGTIESLNAFLGVAPRGDLVQAERVYNRGEGKPLSRGPMTVLTRSGLYRRLIRPLLPLGARDRLRDALLPKADRPPDPSPETVRYIAESVHEDVSALQRILGADAPWWALEPAAA